MIKNYDWDLDAILSGQTIDDLYKKWSQNLDVLATKSKTYFENLDSFKEYLQLNYDNSLIFNKIINYISNHLNEDLVNREWIAWSQIISNQLQDFFAKTSDEENDIIANQVKIEQYLKDPQLSKYQRSYDLLFKNKKRILSKKEEKLIVDLSRFHGGFEDIYSTIVDATIDYGYALDSKNKKTKIKSLSHAFELLKNHDRILRKNVWIAFNKAYFDHRFCLTKTLYYNYLMLNQTAKIRKYNDYVESATDDDEVDKEFVNLIYSGVKKFACLYKRFYDSRKKLIKNQYQLDEVEPWDLSLDVIKNKKKYTIEQIQATLLDVFQCLGNEYVSTMKKAFDQRWISWLPKPNKQSGAYSIGSTKGLDRYYISMNYNGTIDSLYTAAHELGHSLHSYYFCKNQDIYASCNIFYAEIASIVNEMILNYYLLDHAKSKKKKILILDELLTGFFATTTRQIIFSNFEYEMIELLNNNTPISCEVIFAIYNQLQSNYTNNPITKKASKEPYLYSQATILRISHFYVGNFYVYKYSIGQICAMIIAKKLYDQDRNTIEKYFQFLSSGSSLSPIDTIKLLGIDFYDQNTWKECFDNINQLIKMYQLLIKDEK